MGFTGMLWVQAAGFMAIKHFWVVVALQALVALYCLDCAFTFDRWSFDFTLYQGIFALSCYCLLLIASSRSFFTLVKKTSNLMVWQNQFLTIFDNLEESTIVLSDGRPEYVNHSFIQQF